MWIAQFLDGQDNITSTLFLKGPVIKIGRKEEHCLSFSTDKTISRNHAEIQVKGTKAFLNEAVRSDGKGATVGTFFMNGNVLTKMNLNEILELTSGQTVRFGAQSSVIRFVKADVNVCITRLEKRDKELVKSVIQILDGSILKDANDASHVLTNSISGATGKILTAIVLQKKIVTTAWFDFATTNMTSAIIPSSDDFFPPVEAGTVLLDRFLPRCNLLKV